jgi:CubicO group peptidase (beta-lactamase class C family)
MLAMKSLNRFNFLLIPVLAALMLSGITNASAAGSDVYDPAVVEAFVDGVVTTAMKEHHSPSGVVMVMKDGNIIFAKGYGYIDVEKRIPVDPYASMFRPGSISKLFTWVSVMQLVEQGKLDLDTDVNEYLETFKIKDTWPGQPVTLRNILTHTPGFEDGGLGYLIVDDPDKIIPLAESLEKYQPDRINPPGLHTAYSNYATALAGLIVSNVSGMAFNDYLQKNIFDVLGMTHSTFEEPLPADLEPYMAKAYKYDAGTDSYIETNYEIVTNFGPAGAMATSAYDMSLFAKALLNDGSYEGKRILQADTLQRMLDEGYTHDDRVRGMALGFLERRFGPEDFENFGHDGGTTKFISHFGMSKKEDFMLFSSFSGPGSGKTAQAFVGGFYNEFFPVDTPYIEPPADFADRAGKYIGQYSSWRGNFTEFESVMRGLGSTKVVALPDNTLMIGEDKFVEVEENLFRGVDDNKRVAFQQDEDGNIYGFVYDGLGVMQFYRTPFYETPNFAMLLILFSLFIMLAVLLRLAYQWSTFRALPGPEKHAQQTSVVVSILNFSFFILAILAASRGIMELMYGLPGTLKAALFIANLAALAALYHLYQAVQVWRHGLFKSKGARFRYTFVTLAALALTWFYFHWNLTGFNYYS